MQDLAIESGERMPRLKIRAILTDFDGVIRHFPRSRDEEIETEHGLPLGTLARIAFQPMLLNPAITGKVSDEEWRDSVKMDLTKVVGEEIANSAVSKWSDFPGIIDRDALDFILLNKAHQPVALLTNATSRLNRDLLLLGIQDAFSMIFNSSEIGHFKPDPKIFEHACLKLRCQPGEILFIDDSLSHIESARSMGFHAHHYRDAENLRRYSDEIGIG